MRTGESVRVEVEVVAAEFVNFAMAHNRMSFLRRVTLNFPELADRGETVRELVVEVTVRDPRGEVLSRPCRQVFTDLDPSRPLTIDHPPVRLDPRTVSLLEEQVEAEIEVTAHVVGYEPVRSFSAIRVLAASQWVLDPNAPLISLELLAAFVQPNHPDVAAVVAQLGDRLAASTKDPSLDTLNVTDKRIDAIVTAVCEIVNDRAISYALPPASWGYGQKVRGIGDIFGSRVGTCLDLTLAIASVLEHLGIAPVLWIAQGHAFLGWWRQPLSALPDAVSLQVTSAINAVDLKLVGVIETTLLTRERRPPRDVVARARQAPLDHYFQVATAELVGVIDVAMCRTVGVLPMPVRRLRDDGVTEVVEYHAADHSAVRTLDRAPEAATDAPARRRAADPVPPRIQAWKNNLLDLTLRNPLLNFGRATQLPLIVPQGRVGQLADLIQDGSQITIRAADDLSWAVLDSMISNARGLPGDIIRTMLSRHHTMFSAHDGVVHTMVANRLRYRARTARQETGANLLMLTLAQLEWTLGERSLTAPLLLMPVELKGNVPPYKIVADPAGQLTLNLSLLEKLRLEFGFSVPGLEDLPLRADGDGVDAEEVIRSVRQAIADQNLPFRVGDDARLAIIAFTGYLLWRDLDTHWQQFLQRPLVRHLALTPTDPFDGPDDVVPADADLDALTAAAPIPADGSQAEAVAAAAAGNSYVLEGPPGTGKSQTITNIIANQLATGRTVLFVAEKGAALDVVRRRLEEIGLLPFALDLHSDSARPTDVRRQLKHALNLRPLVDTVGYTSAASDVTASSATLADYARRLHARNAADLNLYSAHNLQLARGEGPVLDVPATAGGARDTLLRSLPRLAVLDETCCRAWGFVSRSTAPDDVGPQLAAADAAVQRALVSIPDPAEVIGAAIRHAISPAEVLDVAELLRGDCPTPAILTEAATDRWQQAATELTNRWQTLTRDAHASLATFSPDVLQIDLAAVRQGLREAGASFFIGRKGRLLAAGAPVLAHLRSGAQVEPSALVDQVEILVGLAERQRALASGWRGLPGLETLPEALNLLSAEGATTLERTRTRLLDLRSRWQGVRPEVAEELRRARQQHWISPQAYSAVTDAAQALSRVTAQTGTRTDDLRRWVGADGVLAAWADSTALRAADLPQGGRLRRWSEAVADLEPLRDLAPQARWQLLTGQVRHDDALAALERGLATASLSERMEAGAFRSFDPHTQDRAVQRFVTGSESLRASLRTALPAAVVANRPFQTGRLFGSVGALEREVGRSRGGLPVRKLIQQYGSVIAEVTPCVLVSPDSLAQFIPPGAMPFDLVVFDEASQITVADAIGALGRADAAVIAGDSKQMPPSTFAQTGVDSDSETEADDFAVVPDEESILSEAVQAGLPRLWLTWHYRSRDERLITFSNHHYYDGRLLTFPAVPGRGLDRGLTFTRVPGTFIRSRADGDALLRTNPVEATAVADEVLRRWRAGERSIGVVTFNIQQRGLIEQLLVEAGDAALTEAVHARNDGVFVKNLENVQGDERDVVLFSTGFAAAANGVLPLNFGPLNRAGGERRLNVAVTRARRRVMVFSSFDPEDLRADQTNSVGIKHLRAYLELAASRSSDSSGDPQLTATADRHRDQVAQALRDRGLHVRTGLGLSDFQIDLAVGAAEESPQLAVLLDSPAWAARRTTSDRDGLPHTVLLGQGWPAVSRVWLPAWLADPGGVLDQLERDLAAAATTQHRDESSLTWLSATAASAPEADDSEAVPDGPATDGPPMDGPETDGLATDGRAIDGPALDGPASADPLGLHSGGSTSDDEFIAFEPTIRGSTSALEALLTRPYRSADLAAVLREIVVAEGPISEARLGRHLVRSFGLSRLSDVRLTQLRPRIPADLRRDDEGFIWPPDRDPLTWNGYRRTTGPLKERPLDEVALIEVANAVIAITQAAMGIPIDDLLRETIKTFGGSRVTSTTEPRLRAALELAMAGGKIRLGGGLVMPG